MNTNICDFMLLFRSYLFVRAPFAQTPRRSTEEGRPDTVVEVWARSMQCVACGVRFFLAGVDKTISRVFSVRCFFQTLFSVVSIVGVFCSYVSR